MTLDAESRQSTYLEYLPAIFQQSIEEEGAAFVGRFLLAFERILTGFDVATEDGIEPGIERKLDHIHTYFDPATTPSDFLPWLAGWVAFTLREDWSEDEKRRLISRIVPLYRKRGTKAGLKELLEIYAETEVQINEFRDPMQVASHSTIGEDTILGAAPAHHFQVIMTLVNPDYVDFTRKEQIARAIIDREKPAHTTYDLIVDIPTMQIGGFSTIAKDTLLGRHK
ncbi:MAG: phage tail protein I [Chloroflexi bacterium]|nr:MAG: phage tail protein I [Phototrophicales bacterium]RMF82208.1 MAG: phage tail protein I [Chloroflexota bacterium]